ncbi:MAG: bifunctional phosphopantothenoylcysteine decarboxylase/phosphopantothenate--cysteine ligase CoaBC [Pseudomonadota bacterium]
MSLLAGKRILLGVTGGIAAYKSAELIRRLQDQGADVHVAMTNAATEFITPLTLQGLSGHPVHLDLLDTETESVMGHIELARWADLILIAPASANFIARLAQGHGNDLLSTICLAAQCQIAVAPAMNQGMWANQATQENIRTLIVQQIAIFGPDEGLQACGEVGEGRLLDIAGIVDLTVATFPNERLRGRKVVITAGPTREAIDPVRYISNHSSGKQGYALAEAAIEAGAEVILISGPTSLTPPERARLIPVTSAREMHTAAMQEAIDADIFIGVAAVADFRPTKASDQKIKKDKTGERLTLTLEENPDIIAAVAGLNDGPYTVGFAAETSHVIDYARRKLTKKKLNMIIANDVADQNIGFNSDENETTIIWGNQEQTLSIASKRTIATKIVSTIADALPEARQ